MLLAIAVSSVILPLIPASIISSKKESSKEEDSSSSFDNEAVNVTPARLNKSKSPAKKEESSSSDDSEDDEVKKVARGVNVNQAIQNVISMYSAPALIKIRCTCHVGATPLCNIDQATKAVLLTVLTLTEIYNITSTKLYPTPTSCVVLTSLMSNKVLHTL